MKLTWLGHSGFRMEIADQVLLLDPWLEGNPAFDSARKAEAIAGATHILISHGHFDHASEVPQIAVELGIPIVGIFDLTSHWEKKHGVKAIGFNRGGTVALGGVKVTMVNATHSSSWGGSEGPVYGGSESGFMIAGEGRTVYFSGDTDVMADMGVFEALHHPEIGILCAGGHFTMDMARAAYAARTFFNFRTVIPCHYKTFPLLEQSAEKLREGLPGVDVIEPEVMVPIDL
ncbi:metal-dependent hydrolase [Amaricoccus sp.]|uniref:metal-dependent hydrolase n=1 Tax=Amaricoccus sp. TaxID=1872485 RepID=UPI001B64C244|nr:metal-dependent hydrolase [Amaricoccus sp.]MBP7001391.1 metal-dependent hydrolase [Amaricoccus sp.]